MDYKGEFARTINELSGMPPMSECYNYGMTWGCDEDCPALKKGNCEIFEDIEDYLDFKDDPNDYRK